MHRRECLTVVLISILIGIGGCRGSKSTGSATALRVSFTEVAKSPDARTISTNLGKVVFDRGVAPELPSRPSSGTRKQASTAGPANQKALHILPCNTGLFPCPFDGVVQDNCASCTNPPPDPNAAVGAGEIVEVVNDLIQVTNRLGAVQCGGPVTLNRLLRTSDSLTDPRVQFDNVNQRFSLSVTVSNPGASDTPAMFVAATETQDACGTWFVYRLTFHGDAYPTGAFLGLSYAGPGHPCPLALSQDLPA